MKKIVLISCASKKNTVKSKAKDMYFSPLFLENLRYANSLKPHKIFILSAKYGLLDLNEEIEPYNETLNEKTQDEIKKWSEKVLDKLKKESNLNDDKFIFLAGNNYRKFLIEDLKNYEIPMKNLGIGKQLKFLKDKKDKEDFCLKIHNLFNNMKRFSFPFNEEEIPLNGIYIFFEKGEKFENLDRIVRVGTHTGENQLRLRLNQPFLNENKDRSIFRKNISGAILNKRKDPYFEIWELDFTTKDAKQKFGHLINNELQGKIEKEVSKYIQDNFSFVVFEVKDKKKRLELESKIISTLSLFKDSKHSKSWLGVFSTKEKIRESGLWLVNELFKEPLSEENLIELKNISEKK